jgi:hypothetical protein
VEEWLILSHNEGEKVGDLGGYLHLLKISQTFQVPRTTKIITKIITEITPRINLKSLKSI